MANCCCVILKLEEYPPSQDEAGMPLTDFSCRVARYSDLIFIPPAAIGVGLLAGWKIDGW